MNKWKLAFVISAFCILYLAGSVTPAFATQYQPNPNYGFYNLWFSPNGATCSNSGDISVSLQANQQYAEFSPTDVQGWYGYQLNIRTPDIYPGTNTQISFQQTLGVVNQSIYNTGVSPFGKPGDNGAGPNANPPLPQNTINPSLSTTTTEFTQILNSNGQIDDFHFYFTYSGGGVYEGDVYVPTALNPSYLANANQFSMSIDGSPSQGGYAFFIQGSGQITYAFPSNSPANSKVIGTDCEVFGTGESSTMVYGSATCSISICTQPYSYGLLRASISASTTTPGLGEAVSLYGSINYGVVNAANTIIKVIDETTNNVVGTCPVQNSPSSGFTCIVSQTENSAITQDYYSELVGPTGYVIASSAPIAITWSSGTSQLLVTSVDQNNNVITGYYTELDQNGVKIGSGFTPYTFNNVIVGQQYMVFVDDYGNCVFNHWDDGSTSRQRTFTMPVSNTVFTAHYNCGGGGSGSLTVDSVDQNNNPITGYYVGLYDSNHNLITSSYTPHTFSDTVGTNYYVEPDSYGTCTFNHWQDTGSTIRDRSFTAQSSQTFVAVYQCT